MTPLLMSFPDEPDHECTLAEFEQGNADDGPTLEAVRALAPGQTVTLGFGVTVTRLYAADADLQTSEPSPRPSAPPCP